MDHKKTLNFVAGIPVPFRGLGVSREHKTLACLQAAVGLFVFSVCLAVGDAVIGSAHQANPMLAWLLMNLAGDPAFWTSEELRAVMQRDAQAGWMVLWPQMRLSLSALSGLLAAWVLRPALSEAVRSRTLPAAGA